ncbi:unnamed protein product [Prorocentrum cordatum]|uniref:C2 domain-containing protein n=1 Tax=Prorocentrum cordatum TaxID=2364126 RepID=A0ABN9U9U6_9DINO|nr:unnamed protein product [Polarella glacialis]
MLNSDAMVRLGGLNPDDMVARSLHISSKLHRTSRSAGRSQFSSASLQSKGRQASVAILAQVSHFGSSHPGSRLVGDRGAHRRPQLRPEMGASGSTGPDRHNGNAGSGERPGHRVRRVRVTGAGLPQVNGVYLPTADFAGGEAFQLEVNKDSIKKIYIRCRSDNVRDAWVISMSSNSDVSGGNLYKRECESEEQITPPLFGWKPCAASDGLPGSLATQVVQGVPKLKYHYGPLEEINWDCQPPSPAQLHKPKATRGMPPRQEGISSSLTVCVIGANNIPSTRAREFHVACQVPGKNQTIESVAVPASQDPEFRLKTPFQSWRRPDDLQFTLYAERDIKIGVASLDYEYFSESGFVGEIPVTLFGNDSQEVTMSVCVALPGQVTPGVDVDIRKSTARRSASRSLQIHRAVP